MAALKIPSIFTAVDKMTAPMRKMGHSVQGFAAKAEIATARADRAFRRVMSPVKRLSASLGSFGLMLGGTAIVGAVGGAINKFKEFEQANANLSSILSDATGPELTRLQKQAKDLGAVTARTATEVVGLQEAFARLGFVPDEIEVMTKATIDGSVAMNAELAATAELAGAMVRTFDTFNAGDAPMILDQMTLATQKSALNFEKLETSLPIVMGAANAAGLSFSETTAILGKLSDAGIDASSSATALRNIFIESEKQGLNYTQILEKIKNSSGKLTASFDEFGKRGAVAGAILSEKLDEVSGLTKILNDEYKGTASEAAAKQLNTLGGALTVLGSAWEGWILSLEDGNGKFSKFLRNVVEVVTEVLSLASGTAKSADELDRHGQKVRMWAERASTFLKVIAGIVGFMIAWKIAIMAANAALVAYNIVLGIMGALSGTASIAIGKNTVALTAYKIVTWLASSATGAFATALGLAGLPIWLIAAAIIAMIALITTVVVKWNEWGAALSLFLGPLGMVISMIQSFRRNWDMIKDAFKEGGIKEGIKAIGITLLDSVLMPMQQLLEIASKLPGKLGSLAAEGAKKLEGFRTNLGIETDEKSTEKPAVNPEKARQDGMANMITNVQKQMTSITIADETGRASVESDNDLVPIQMTSTVQ